MNDHLKHVTNDMKKKAEQRTRVLLKLSANLRDSDDAELDADELSDLMELCPSDNDEDDDEDDS